MVQRASDTIHYEHRSLLENGLYDSQSGYWFIALPFSTSHISLEGIPNFCRILDRWTKKKSRIKVILFVSRHFLTD